jgi:hypothetical protein
VSVVYEVERAFLGLDCVGCEKYLICQGSLCDSVSKIEQANPGLFGTTGLIFLGAMPFMYDTKVGVSIINKNIIITSYFPIKIERLVGSHELDISQIHQLFIHKSLCPPTQLSGAIRSSDLFAS